MRDALNFFLPFRRLEPNHENQLTRALLVVLRLSPMAHTAWLRLVAPDRELQRLPVASYDTQCRAVRDGEEGGGPDFGLLDAGGAAERLPERLPSS